MKSLFQLSLILSLCTAPFIFIGCGNDDDNSAPDRDKFLGAYNTVETCGSGNDAYEITIITSGTADNAIIINNLYDFAASISATVSGNNITIASQLVSGITYSGTGSITDNILTINFVVSDASSSDNCIATATRK